MRRSHRSSAGITGGPSSRPVAVALWLRNGRARAEVRGSTLGRRLREPAWDALFEALAVFYWRKRDLENFLRGHLRDFPELLAPLSFAGYKRSVAADLVGLLRRNEDRYQGLAIDLLVELAKFDERFPRLAREEDGARLVTAARSALEDVRAVVGTYSAEAEARAKLRADIEAEAADSAQRRSHAVVLGELSEVFMALHSGPFTPQDRGLRFESLLNDLFALFDLEPKAAYVLKYEQIDGAFTFRTDDYLLEARWWKEPVEPKHLRDFEGKIRAKAQNVLGLFISINGFSEGARSKSADQTPLILMDGTDLLAVLESRIELPELLERKRRHAAQTGSPWLPVSHILSD